MAAGQPDLKGQFSKKNWRSLDAEGRGIIATAERRGRQSLKGRQNYNAAYSNPILSPAVVALNARNKKPGPKPVTKAQQKVETSILEDLKAWQMRLENQSKAVNASQAQARIAGYQNAFDNLQLGPKPASAAVAVPAAGLGGLLGGLSGFMPILLLLAAWWFLRRR